MKDTDQCYRDVGALRKAGFTLIEQLTVIATIGAVSALILGLFGFAIQRSSEARAKVDLEKIRNALEEYKLDNGKYLDPEDFKRPRRDTYLMTDVVFTNLHDYALRYDVDTSYLDPWGRAYEYEFLERYQYRVFSKGSDPRKDEGFIY